MVIVWISVSEPLAASYVSGHRRRDFVAVVGKAAAGMKRKMPRAAAGRRFAEGRIVRRERSLGRVELVDQQLVEAQIRREGEAVVGRDVDRMGVRAGLPLLDRAGAFVLNGGGRLFERAVGLDRQRGDAAAAVVGDERTWPVLSTVTKHGPAPSDD